MKKFISFTVAAAILTGFVGCSDETYDINMGLQHQSAAVTLHAVRYDSHRGLDSTQIEIVGHGIAAITDMTGCVTFALPAGNYELKASRPGYLTVIENFSVTLANEQSDMPIVNTDLTDIELHPLTGAIKGRVTTILNDNERRYQAGAEVRVKIAGIETDAVFQTQTDNEGAYAIDSLPEGIALTCEARYFDGGSVYTGTQTTQELRADVTTNVATIAMSCIENSYQYDIFTRPATQTDPLVITFPVAAQLDDIRADDITVTNTAQNIQVGIITSWSEGNRTLTIRTADPNGWRSGSETDYTVSVNVPNVEGGRLTANEQFGIAKYTGELAAVRCEYDPSTNMISWPLLPNASNYKIYVASSDDNDYLFKTIVSFSGNGPAELPISTVIDENDRKVYYVKIVGVNSQYEGNLAQAKELTIAHINPQSVFYDTGTKMIHWSEIDCATAYRIYMKVLDTESYTLKYTVPVTQNNTNDTSISAISVFGANNFGTYYIKVIGVYNNILGNIGTAEELRIDYTY